MSSESRPPGISSLRNRLLSGSAWALGGKVGASVIGLTTNVILARMLSPGELGAYFLALSIVSFGAIVGCFGLNRSAVRFVAEALGLERRDRARRIVALVIGIGVAGALVSSGAYLLIGPLIAERLFGSPALVAVTGLVAGWIALSTVQELFAETFRGFHDIRLATLFGGVATGGNSAGLIMRVMLIFALATVWLAGGETDLTTVMLVMVGSASVTTFMSVLALRVRMRSVGSTRSGRGEASVREVLGVSAPLFINNITVFFLTQSDLWIVGAFGSGEEVAIYGAASRFVALVTMPLLVVNAVLPPVIAEMYAQGERGRLEGMLRPFATLAGIPSVIALALFALAGGPILGLVYGEFYAGGALVLALLSLGKLAFVVSGSCGLTLQMTGNQTLIMWISILSGVLFFVGAIWAVQAYGAAGVASVSAGSVIFQSLLMVLAAKWKTGIWTHVNLSVAPVLKVLKRR
ncbi:flippase [Rubrobacter aplysinae]|uniref:flippase n=1 Tax=Rubrobacter aplysinae TaxID=909625 RepID=UPI001364A5F9|nr:flippase [Rubrobacter aplysinae]